MPATNRVEEITANSPADQGQFQAGDEIIAVNDAPVVDCDTLILAINSHGPGDEVKLKVRRNGKELDQDRGAGQVPVDPEMIATNRPPAWRGLRVDYLSTLSANAGFPPNPEERGGVVVTEVQDDSPAARAGLKKWPRTCCCRSGSTRRSAP